MSFNKQIKSIKMLFDVFNPDKQVKPIIYHGPAKKSWEGSVDNSHLLALSSPELEGINSDYIKSYINDLNQNPQIDLHNILILRHGNIVWKQSFNGYNSNLWHVCHSLSKTVTGLAIGMLWDDSLIDMDECISDIFSQKITKKQYQNRKKVTVKTLLNMTSGVMFNEISSYAEENWISGFFDSVAISDSDKEFHYNSINSFILSAIIKEKTGQCIMDYLESRLWRPLAVQNVYWELAPCGIEKGGWGLYLTINDAAKIGQLIMNGGRWGNKQLISQKWINMSIKNVVETSSSFGEYNYGYHIWTGKHQNSFLLNGLFGQNVLGFMDTGILIVVNSGNVEIFQQGPFFDITHKYFGRDYFPSSTPLPELTNYGYEISNEITTMQNNPGEKQDRLSFMRLARKLDGNKFRFEEKNASTVGLLPIITQVIQNNFTKGIEDISFQKGYFHSDKGKIPMLTAVFTENGQSHNIPIIYNEKSYMQLEFGGEIYEVCISNTVRNGKLKIRLSFLEMAGARTIELKLTKKGSEIELTFNEIPSYEFINKSMELFVSDKIKSKPTAGMINKGINALQKKIKNTFVPVITGKKIQ